MLRLRDFDRALANFFASGIFNLREKLGPFLWQFPPNFAFEEERFERFFAALPRTTEDALALARRRDARMKGRSRLAIDASRPLRHAVEIRHPSFVDPQFVDLLRAMAIALVVADTARKWPYYEDVTADFCISGCTAKRSFTAAVIPRRRSTAGPLESAPGARGASRTMRTAFQPSRRRGAARATSTAISTTTSRYTPLRRTPPRTKARTFP
jgi:hypothetical protein